MNQKWTKLLTSGGERGIRTLGRTCALHSLSRDCLKFERGISNNVSYCPELHCMQYFKSCSKLGFLVYRI